MDDPELGYISHTPIQSHRAVVKAGKNRVREAVQYVPPRGTPLHLEKLHTTDP